MENKKSRIGSCDASSGGKKLLQAPPSPDRSDSKFWHPVLFKPVNSEQALELGFVEESLKRKVPASVDGHSEEDEDSPPSDGRFICFPLGPSFPGAAELKQTYTEVKPRLLTEFVRDIQIVSGCHIKKLISFGALFPSPSINTEFPKLAPSENVLVGLKSVVDLLTETLAVLKETVDAGSTSMLGPSSSIQSQPPPGFGIVHELTNGSNILLSKLATIYWMSLNAELPQHIHVADYCVARSETMMAGEPIFSDGKGMFLLRSQIGSLDWCIPVDSSVVNVFARICNNKWKGLGMKWKTTLDVVIKDSRQLSVSDLLNHWITYLVDSSIDLSKANLVSIPLCMDNHHCLLFVDFRCKMIKLVDTVLREDKSRWIAFARSVASCFGNLLQWTEDPRVKEYYSFEHTVVNPPWSQKDSDHDSGISTMTLINLYGDPRFPFEKIELEKEVDRLRSRMSMCVNIVMDKLNILRQDVLLRVRSYVADKACHKLQPSVELRELIALLT